MKKPSSYYTGFADARKNRGYRPPVQDREAYDLGYISGQGARLRDMPKAEKFFA